MNNHDTALEALNYVKNDLLDIAEERAMHLPRPVMAKRSLEWLDQALAQLSAPQSDDGREECACCNGKGYIESKTGADAFKCQYCDAGNARRLWDAGVEHGIGHAIRAAVPRDNGRDDEAFKRTLATLKGQAAGVGVRP